MQDLAEEERQPELGARRLVEPPTSKGRPSLGIMIAEVPPGLDRGREAGPVDMPEAGTPLAVGKQEMAPRSCLFAVLQR